MTRDKFLFLLSLLRLVVIVGAMLVARRFLAAPVHALPAAAQVAVSVDGAGAMTGSVNGLIRPGF